MKGRPGPFTLLMDGEKSRCCEWSGNQITVCPSQPVSTIPLLKTRDGGEGEGTVSYTHLTLPTSVAV